MSFVLCCFIFLSTAMTTKLTTEQQRAITVLEEKLVMWKSLLNQPIHNCTQTNFFCFSISPIRREHLPHEEHWVWNQSNAKLCTTMYEGRVGVTIQKFNARKKPKYDQRQPSYKVWIFTLENYLPDPLYALWCEKGKQFGEEPELVAVHNHIPKVQPEELRLESFDFLRDFVSEESALEFGWITPNQGTNFRNHNTQNLPQQNVIPPPHTTTFVDNSFTHFTQEYYRSQQ